MTNKSHSLLEIDDLHVNFTTKNGVHIVLCGVNLHLQRGEALGLVGASGCGKSVTALATMGLLGPSGVITAGSIHFDGHPLLALPEKNLRMIRGKRIGMVFQDPARALNPTLTIGYQIGEMLQLHEGMTRRQAKAGAIDLLSMVGIADPASRYESYAFQLSGGMCQRAVIAMAIACKPDLLIADEPTTALDVTVQAQIIELLRSLQQLYGMALLLISHDLAVVASLCERVAVMCGGKVVEDSPVDTLFTAPVHSYTHALLSARRKEVCL
jgi:ABC-type dipeptide/oligopeptide/nickel transport system ATPase component